MKTENTFTHLKPQTGVPLYRQAAESLLTYVRSSGLEADTPIPTPKQIGKELGINELTVRRGIKLLIEQQLLYSVKGKGTFVYRQAVEKTVLFVLGLRDLQLSLNDYFQILYRKLGEELKRHDIELETISCIQEDDYKVKRYCSELSALRYTGYLFTACNPEHPMLRYMQSNSRNHVWCSSNPASHCTLASDMSDARLKALRFLADAGHKKVTVFSCTNTRDTEERVKNNFEPLLVDTTLPKLTHQTVFECQGRSNDLERGGYDLMTALIKEKRAPKAMLITNNLIAREISRALLSTGRAMTESNCVLITTEEQAIPLGFPLTYVCRSIADEAKVAVDMLLQQMHSDMIPGATTLPYTLKCSEKVEGNEDR